MHEEMLTILNTDGELKTLVNQLHVQICSAYACWYVLTIIQLKNSPAQTPVICTNKVCFCHLVWIKS